MSIKGLVTPEQWKALINAPSAAANYAATASGGGLEIFKEVFTAMKVIQESTIKAGGSGYGKVVDDLLTTMKEMTFEDAKAASEKYESRDLAAIRAEAKQVVADAAAAVSTLPEGEGYKQWILYIAQKVSETRTGGFLGYGSTSVIDEKEQAALNELAVVLGLVK